jgi:hypothetical protein
MVNARFPSPVRVIARKIDGTAAKARPRTPRQSKIYAESNSSAACRIFYA